MTLLERARELADTSHDWRLESVSGSDAVDFARVVVALAEAMPRLRREHGGFEGEEGYMRCPRDYDPPGECKCDGEEGKAIDRHNAALAELAKMMEATS